ncbi:type II toxin-antitoxin system PemK/MazF family toxin [Sandaracinobacteroides saxicola]|uniref:Type II toxin-antitoxin system PemK/MazF family toxin n=1 Tax=Sandaracinobacteroides saxicola TaxID=2759707 RepID=A0A7G5IK77_9SPHN|nr:type II toxin-antitoxin system PemK/MazF family toxin [Sandaracinobacteroides saxicola]QMW23769.1 type II toxin-antitoxin system PemK/MazF family toxin [Sandaracinobacteroides saxicola]
MKRGELVIVREPHSPTSKARPCVIVQTNRALPDRSYLTICPLTTQLSDSSLFRVHVLPSDSNGLKRPSDVEVDLIYSVAVAHIGPTIGMLDRSTMVQVDAALRRWLEL